MKGALRGRTELRFDPHADKTALPGSPTHATLLSMSNELPREPEDKRKAECPYCHQALPKIPAKKTKCPHCGQVMYVRTRPKDRARVVVTQDEAEKIEEEWAIVSGTHDAYVTNKQRIEDERIFLRERFSGRDPSDRDIQWSLLNKDSLKYAQRADWGLYRNARFDMGEILRRELKLRPALEMYLEVCYLDLNGPRNTGGLTDLCLLRQFPPFDPRDAYLAPAVIGVIDALASKLQLDRDSLKRLFIEHNVRIHKALHLPLVPEACWPILEKEVQQAHDTP